MKNKPKPNLFIYSSMFSILFLIFTILSWLGASFIWLITGNMIGRGNLFNFSLVVTTIFFILLIIISLIQKKPQ